MFRFSVQTDIQSISRRFGEMGKKQIPFATAKALTMTVEDVAVVLRKQIPVVFNKPVPFTRNSIFKKSASKSRLTAMVWVKDDGATRGTPAVKYLAPQIYGGQRNVKRFERALQAAGVLPVSMMAVPGQAADIDAYGNMSKAQIVQILSYLNALRDSKDWMSQKRKNALAKGSEKRNVRGFEYFVVRPGARNLAPGIWKRVGFGFGKSIKPVLMFVRPAQYRKRWKFFETSQSVTTKRFPINFDKAMRDAIKTAWR